MWYLAKASWYRREHDNSVFAPPSIQSLHLLFLGQGRQIGGCAAEQRSLYCFTANIGGLVARLALDNKGIGALGTDLCLLRRDHRKFSRTDSAPH